MYRSDWDGTNHYEITDSEGEDYFFWTLEDLLFELGFTTTAQYDNVRFDSSKPLQKILGEMMDAWVEKKNKEEAI